MARALVVSVVAFSAFGCAPATDDTSEADRQMINEMRERETAAFSSGDLDVIMAIVTDDAVVMPPNEPRLQGHDAMREWLEGMYEQVSVQVQYTSSNLTLAGDWAFEEVAFTLTTTPVAGGEPVQETGKGFHVYARQPDGSWRIALDIWNTDTPPAG